MATTFRGFGVRRGLLVASMAWATLGSPGVMFGPGPVFGNEPATGTPEATAASRERIASDLEYLSSDAMRGRNTGSPEIEKAAEYIAERFNELGFNTDLYDGTPFQRFTAFREITMGPVEENQLGVALGEDAMITLKLDEAFRPLSLGGSGIVEGPLVFAGYGITAPDAGYDDYAGLDVTGKVVVVIRGQPRSGRGDSPLGGRRNSRYAFFTTKYENAVDHGAAALLVVNHAQGAADEVARVQRNLERQRESLEKTRESLAKLPEGAENTREKLEESLSLAEGQVAALEAELELAPEALLALNQAGKSSSKEAIPVISLGRESLNRILVKAGKFDAAQPLQMLEGKIDESFEPVSFELESSRAQLRATLVDRDVVGINVLGEMPGKGALADETVVIGAHYDHVGMGGPGSLAPGTIAVHNGADDNGSGTVTMMELAHRLSKLDWKEHRRIVFMAFSGEEKGLLGSKHYAREPRFPLEQTVAMINLDMVGRLNEREMLTVFGTGTAPSFDGLVDEWTETFDLPVRKDPSGSGPSDHTSFYEKQVPVLFFFTGLHPDYHRPSDDFEKINLDGMVRITDMVSQAAVHLATVAERPQFQTTGRGYGIRPKAYLGVSLRAVEDGVKITDVSEGGPAAKAGLRVGDIIQKMGELEPTKPEDIQAAVGETRPGRKFEMTLLRDGETVTITVELGVRT